jgi:hypothetical protein
MQWDCTCVGSADGSVWGPYGYFPEPQPTHETPITTPTLHIYCYHNTFLVRSNKIPMLGVVSASCGASSSCAKQLRTVQRYAFNLKWCDKQMPTHHVEKYQCVPTRSVTRQRLFGVVILSVVGLLKPTTKNSARNPTNKTRTTTNENVPCKTKETTTITRNTTRNTNSTTNKTTTTTNENAPYKTKETTTITNITRNIKSEPAKTEKTPKTQQYFEPNTVFNINQQTVRKEGIPPGFPFYLP